MYREARNQHVIERAQRTLRCKQSAKREGSVFVASDRRKFVASEWLILWTVLLGQPVSGEQTNGIKLHHVTANSKSLPDPCYRPYRPNFCMHDLDPVQIQHHSVSARFDFGAQTSEVQWFQWFFSKGTHNNGTCGAKIENTYYAVPNLNVLDH